MTEDTPITVQKHCLLSRWQARWIHRLFYTLFNSSTLPRHTPDTAYLQLET